jgi:hypothetical protein
MRSQACSIASIEDRIRPRAGAVATLLVEPDAVADEGPIAHQRMRGGGLVDRRWTRRDLRLQLIDRSNQRRGSSPLRGFAHFAAGRPGNVGIAA